MTRDDYRTAIDLIGAEIDRLHAQNADLLVALKSLVLAVIRHTNVNCLQRWIDEARTVIIKAERREP